MSMSDPISDMLTRIRNALSVSKKTAKVPFSKSKESISEVLKNEGYIADYRIIADGSMQFLEVDLKYYRGQPVISELRRVSKPSCRAYFSKSEIPYVRNGFGVAVVSTSQGVMSDKQARANGVGGEVLCTVF